MEWKINNEEGISEDNFWKKNRKFVKYQEISFLSSKSPQKLDTFNS